MVFKLNVSFNENCKVLFEWFSQMDTPAGYARRAENRIDQSFSEIVKLRNIFGLHCGIYLHLGKAKGNSPDGLL